jgi:hypothetical protein
MNEELKKHNQKRMEHYRKISSTFRYSVSEEVAHRKNEGKLEVESTPSKKSVQPDLFKQVFEKLNEVLTRPKIVFDKGNPVLTFVRPSVAKVKFLSKQQIDQKLVPMFMNRTLTKDLYKQYLRLNKNVSVKRTANL